MAGKQRLRRGGRGGGGWGGGHGRARGGRDGEINYCSNDEGAGGRGGSGEQTFLWTRRGMDGDEEYSAASSQGRPAWRPREGQGRRLLRAPGHLPAPEDSGSPLPTPRRAPRGPTDGCVALGPGRWGHGAGRAEPGPGAQTGRPPRPLTPLTSSHRPPDIPSVPPSPPLPPRGLRELQLAAGPACESRLPHCSPASGTGKRLS